MDRRHFLKHMAGLAALASPAAVFVQGLRAQAPALKKEGKSLIILWMGGGPSHMDLWDLKSEHTNGGDFKPKPTAAKGVQISEILPNVAKQFKNLSIVRSLQSNEGSHDRGTTLMNTGRMPSPVVQFPHVGAVASSLLAAKDVALPGFIGIGGTAQRIGAGFLGMTFAPFTVQNPGQPPENIKPPDSLGHDLEQTERVQRRRRLFYAVEDHFAERVFPNAKVGSEERKAIGDAADAHEAVYKKAFDLTVSPLRTVFEVRNEKPATIREYGGQTNPFGMGCLLARKLVEKGVTCVEVDLGGWDNHNNIFPTLRNNLGPRLDKGMAGLVKDLVDRGMWKNTVVLWMGEFGRTPKINQNAGRDHWGLCWSVVLGGGALKGGQVYGSTTADGMDIKEDKVTVKDLFATVYKALGLDPATKIRDNLGRPLSIAFDDVKKEQGVPIKALL
jgi:hypothetical protein